MGNLIIPINDVLLLQLQQLAQKHGRDIETEAQDLLMQSIQVQTHFIKPLNTVEKSYAKAGGWEGKVWIVDDFDAPLDDFAEYM